MNLYLCVYRDPSPPFGGDGSVTVIRKAIVRHKSGESATKVFMDTVKKDGYPIPSSAFETTLLIPEGETGIIIQRL
jgi:hypothetical protein